MEEMETDIWDEMDEDVDITDLTDYSIEYAHALADEMPLYYDDMEFLLRDSYYLGTRHEYDNPTYGGGASKLFKKHWASKDNVLSVMSNKLLNEILTNAPEIEDENGNFYVPYSNLGRIPSCKEPSIKKRLKESLKNQIKIYKQVLNELDSDNEDLRNLLKTAKSDFKRNKINFSEF